MNGPCWTLSGRFPDAFCTLYGRLPDAFRTLLEALNAVFFTEPEDDDAEYGLTVDLARLRCHPFSQFNRIH